MLGMGRLYSWNTRLICVQVVARPLQKLDSLGDLLHDCAGRVTRRKDTTKRLAHNNRTPVPRTLPIDRLASKVEE